MFRYVFAVILLAGGISGDLMDGIYSCPNNVPLPLDVYVYGCEQLPCHVHNGEIVYFEMDFLVRNSTVTITPGVSIVLGPLEIPYELPEEYLIGCNSLIGDISCPLFANDVARYGLGMKVEAPVSGVTVNLEFWLEDDWGHRIVCYRREQRVDPPRTLESTNNHDRS
ncbi:uncharacterized protein LOC129798240 [Phlebotomus papatasi]|uniref:uncharacterized protein LOC129798240 n=1 Tax=Phlebotomus papatasi TaxID=29031 RepID=UPI002483915C|nr:uncharacterized protein LOC129798240 [Phlebotomus papatasi]